MAHDHELYMMLADTATQLHDLQALQTYTPQLEQLALRDHHEFYLGVAHRAWGVAHRLAGEHTKAHTRLKAALTIFTNMGARWQMGRTLSELGELERSRSKAKMARDHFEKALIAFEGIQALPDAERVKILLNE
jgi:tetratricopeptide (TPR) repeat protein